MSKSQQRGKDKAIITNLFIPALFIGDIECIKMFVRKSLVAKKDLVEIIESELFNNFALVVSKNENLGTIKSLIDELNLDFSSQFLGSLLIEAAACHANDVVKYLLEKNADVNYQDNVGDSPLHKAALLINNPGVALLLAKEGIDVHLKNKNGYAPYHIAALKNQEMMFTFLKFFQSKKIKPISLDLGGEEKYDSLLDLAKLARDGDISIIFQKPSIKINREETLFHLTQVHKIILSEKTDVSLQEVNKILKSITKKDDLVDLLVNVSWICEEYKFNGRIKLLEKVINVANQKGAQIESIVSALLILSKLYITDENNTDAAHKTASEALMNYKKAVTIASGDLSKIIKFLPEIYCSLGVALINVNDEDAIKNFKEALKLDSSYQRALFELIMLYIDSENFKEAEKEIHKIKVHEKESENLKELMSIKLELISSDVENTRLKELETRITLFYTESLTPIQNELLRDITSIISLLEKDFETARQIYLSSLEESFSYVNLLKLLHTYIYEEKWDNGLEYLNYFTKKYSSICRSDVLELAYYKFLFNEYCNNYEIATKSLNVLLNSGIFEKSITNDAIAIRISNLILSHNFVEAKKYTKNISDELTKEEILYLVDLLIKTPGSSSGLTAIEKESEASNYIEALSQRAISTITTPTENQNTIANHTTLVNDSDSEDDTIDSIFKGLTSSQIYKYFEYLKFSASQKILLHSDALLHHKWEVKGKIYDTANKNVHKLSDIFNIYGVIDIDNLKTDSTILDNFDSTLSKGLIHQIRNKIGVKKIQGVYEIKIIPKDVRLYTTEIYKDDETSLIVFDKECDHPELERIIKDHHLTVHDLSHPESLGVVGVSSEEV